MRTHKPVVTDTNSGPAAQAMTATVSASLMPAAPVISHSAITPAAVMKPMAVE